MARRPGRGPWSSRRRAAALGLTALLVPACASTRILDRPWIEARSEHFTIYSSLPPDETRTLAVDLEIFRAAVGFFTNIRSLDSPIPVEIFAFASESDFHPFAERGVAGFTRPTPRSYQVAFHAGRDGSERWVLYHEYVHFLLRNNGDMLLPRWYDEGFAEFLSTVERREDGLVVGLPHPIRASWLVGDRPMKVRDVLEPGSYSRFGPREMGRFYARAWLLVHYLSWDYEDPEGRRFADRFSTYLAARERGLAPAEALHRAWGLTPDELDDRLAETIDRGVKTGSLPLERLEYPDRVELRIPAPGRMAERLGALALHGMDPGLARSFFRAALAESPEDARATAGLADTFKLEGRMAEAEPLFERAVELDPDDALNRLDRAEYRLERAAQAEDPERRSEIARKARDDAETAGRLDPQSPEALWVQGSSTALVAGHDPTQPIQALERAAEILPSDTLILYSLLQAYVAAGRQPEARRVARRLVAMAHSREEIDAIERLLRGEIQPE